MIDLTTCSPPVEARTLLDEFAQTGNQAPFEEIVRRYGGMVFNVCYEVTGNRHDAEDAVQAAFLSLAVQERSGEKVIAIGPWLQQVARRMALDINRSRRRRKTREDRHGEMWEKRLVDATDDGGHAVSQSPAAAANWDELRVIVRQELDTLPAKYRMPLVLHYYGGMSRDDMARELGCRANTLGVRLHRARQILGRRLARRGVTLGAVLVGVMLTEIIRSTVTQHLIESTAHAAAMMQAGHPFAAGLISPELVGLARNAGNVMWWAKFKTTLIGCLLMGGVLAAGSEVTAAVTHWPLPRISDLPRKLLKSLLEDPMPVPELRVEQRPARAPVDEQASETAAAPIAAQPLVVRAPEIAAAPMVVAIRTAPPQQTLMVRSEVAAPPPLAYAPSNSVATPRPTRAAPVTPPANPAPVTLSRRDGFGTRGGGGGGGGGSSNETVARRSDRPGSTQLPDDRRPQRRLPVEPQPEAPILRIAGTDVLTSGFAGTVLVEKPPVPNRVLSSFQAMTAGPTAASMAREVVVMPVTDSVEYTPAGYTAGSGALTLAGATVVTKTGWTTSSLSTNSYDSTPMGGALSVSTDYSPAGSASFEQVLGSAAGDALYRISSRTVTHSDVTVGYLGTGVIDQQSGRNTVDSVYLGITSPARGLYRLSSGELAITRTPLDAGAIPHTLDVGSAGEGLLLLGSESAGGNIVETGSGRGVGMKIAVSDSATGTVRGWGRIALSGELVNNGKVVADGMGRPRTLDLRRFGRIRHDGNDSISGWYAQNQGKLALPAIYVGAGTHTYTWGDESSSQGLTLVNSVRVTMHDSTAGVVTIALLAGDRPEIPDFPAGHVGIGFWEFGATTNNTLITTRGGLDLTVRYDDGLAGELGLDETILKLWTYESAKWVRHDYDGSFLRDIDANTLSVHLNGADFKYFAVTAPEPGTMMLVGMGLCVLGMRRRRKV